MKRTDIVLAGAEQLRLTEDAVDTALTEAGTLISLLTRMRVSSGLSGTYGQAAIKEIVGAVSALEKARNRIVKAHGRLNDVKTQMGCGAVMIGTEINKPITGEATAPATSASESAAA